MARTRKRNKTYQKPMAINPNSPKTKFGLVAINELTYGNPNAAQDILIREEGAFDYIANHYMQKPYPNNDGQYAFKELSSIREDMKKLQHDKVVELSVKFDEDLSGMLIETADKCGVSNPSKFIEELYKDINPIIMKLKYFYNRVRPYQLANILSYPLNPMPTISAQSPSYPSGHTVQSRVFAEILSFRYPDQQDMLMKFADKCSQSRIIMGVHFPSDGIFGKQLSDGIILDENFKAKYFNINKIAEGVSSSPIKNFMQNQGGDNNNNINLNNPTPPKIVNENEVFGGIPKAPEGGMPFGPKK
ncbi:phosphatase PAP2 family protein [Akkermansiaceae bacterium]|nr:phosphatase PAP2 family protein [Akkermansiaceae bacterium]